MQVSARSRLQRQDLRAAEWPIPRATPRLVLGISWLILPDLISDVPILVGLVPTVSVDASWRDVFQSADGRRGGARNARHRTPTNGHPLPVTALPVGGR